MHSRSRFQSVALCVACIALAGSAFAESFHITPGEPNLVQFVSKAPLETFKGKTRSVSGSVQLDPNAIGDSITVRVAVDLASLDTGIDIRNRHMRENHLETEKYPTAVFQGGKIHNATATRLQPGDTLRFELDGVLSLHGIDKPLRAPIELTLESVGGALQVRVAASFQVRLSDHGIDRPKFLVIKLDEVQRVTVELIAKAGE